MTASPEDPTAEAVATRAARSDAAPLGLPRRSRRPSAIAEAAAALKSGPEPEPGSGAGTPSPMSVAAAEFAALTAPVWADDVRVPGTPTPLASTAVPVGPAPTPGRPARRRRMWVAGAAVIGVALACAPFLLSGGGDGGAGDRSRSAGTRSDGALDGAWDGDDTSGSSGAAPSGESSALRADGTSAPQSEGRPKPLDGTPGPGTKTAGTKAVKQSTGKNSGTDNGSSSEDSATDTGSTAVGVAIRGRASGRCIDVTGGGTADHTPLQIWDCAGTARQKWWLASDGTVRALGKCMDVRGGSRDDGAVIDLVGCDGTGAQQFTLNSAHDLVNTRADKCVDVKDVGTGNGTRLQLWSCEGSDNQKWSSG